MKLLHTMKISSSFFLGILLAMSITMYFIDPISGWIGLESFLSIPPRYSPCPELLSIAISFCLFYLPLVFITCDNLIVLVSRITFTAIWTALPGSIVALFIFAKITETLGYSFKFLQAFSATALIFTMFFLPLYVVLITPTQIRRYRDVLLANCTLTKRAALMVSLSLMGLPFIGVTLMKAAFHIFSRQNM